MHEGAHLHLAADGTQLYQPPAGPRTILARSRWMTTHPTSSMRSAKTVAVFQVESLGHDGCAQAHEADCIEDIVALVALYRPGPMENIPTFCEVKNGARRSRVCASVD